MIQIEVDGSIYQLVNIFFYYICETTYLPIHFHPHAISRFIIIEFNQSVAKSIIIIFINPIKTMIGKSLVNITKWISPLQGRNQLFSFTSANSNSGMKTIQTLTKNQLIFQKRYSYSSYKLKETAEKVKETAEKVKELTEKIEIIQGKCLKALSDKEDMQRKISSVQYQIDVLKIQINKQTQPNPQMKNKILTKEAEFNFLQRQKQPLETTLKGFSQEKEELESYLKQLIQKDQKTGWIWPLIIALGGLTVAIIVGILQFHFSRRQDQDTKIGKEDRALQDHKNQNFSDKLKEFIKDSPIQQQIKTILSNSIKYKKILYLAGCPGVGKTTSIKHIVQQLRQNNKDIYYIDMRVKPEDVLKKAQEMTHLLHGIQRQYKDHKGEQKSVKVFIDDINSLQNLSEDDLHNKLTIISAYSQTKYLQVVCISSSSRFIEKISSHNRFTSVQKESKFIVLQDLIQPAYENFAGKLLERYCKDASEQAKSYMVNQKYSPREIQSVSQQLENQKKEQQLNFLKQKDRELFDKLMNLCGVMLKKDNKQRIRVLFNRMIQSSEILKLSNCSHMERQIGKSDLDSHQQVKKIIDYLDNENMIIFCRPRRQLYKNVFKQFLRQKVEKKK